MIGIAISIALLTQIDGKVWARVGILLAVALVLWLLNWSCSYAAPEAGPATARRAPRRVATSATPRPRLRGPSAGFPASASLQSGGVRRLFVLVAAVVLVDTMFFAAITPLLPEYADDLGLSKTAAGILSASYAAGTLLGTFPGAWIAARFGVRQTRAGGLGLMSAAGLVFAFAETHRAPGRGTVPAGRRRRLLLDRRPLLARLGRAGGASWRVDRLGPGGGDLRRSCWAR